MEMLGRSFFWCISFSFGAESFLVCFRTFIELISFFLNPMLYPFSVFNAAGRWVQTVWLEEILLYFFLYLTAIITLKDSKYRSLFYFPLLFFVAGIFVQHRDLSRYLLPIWPFAVIAFEQTFTSRKFRYAFYLLLPAIYLYAWNFLLGNIIPVSDWRPFL